MRVHVGLNVKYVICLALYFVGARDLRRLLTDYGFQRASFEKELSSNRLY